MNAETVAVPTVLVFRDRFWLELISHWATSRSDLVMILGSATSFAGLDSIATAGADLAIVDAWIFGPKDVQALRIARELYPQTQFILVSPPRSTRDMTRLRTAGAADIVSSDLGLKSLANAITGTAAYRRRSSFSPVLESPSAPPTLTENERKVLRLYAAGLTLPDLARQMGMSENSAQYYLKRIREKYRRLGIDVSTKLLLSQQAHRDEML